MRQLSIHSVEMIFASLGGGFTHFLCLHIFYPDPWEMIQLLSNFDEHMFQRGLVKNHQLVAIC